jgi:hypothetical protein
VDIGPWSPVYMAVEKLGDQLAFPISLITRHSHRLRYEIARALAITFRLATRAHWRLVIEMLEEPQAQWEKSQRKITERSLDKKQATLENEYLKVFEEQVAQLLTGWGIDAPSDVGISNLISPRVAKLTAENRVR